MNNELLSLESYVRQRLINFVYPIELRKDRPVLDYVTKIVAGQITENPLCTLKKFECKGFFKDNVQSLDASVAYQGYKMFGDLHLFCFASFPNDFANANGGLSYFGEEGKACYQKALEKGLVARIAPDSLKTIDTIKKNFYSLAYAILAQKENNHSMVKSLPIAVLEQLTEIYGDRFYEEIMVKNASMKAVLVS